MEANTCKASAAVKYTEIAARYELQLNSLLQILSESEARLIKTPADAFFDAHINFLVKAYLISLCCYLEAFLKDLADERVARIQRRLALAKVPHNVILWSVGGQKEKEFKFSNFELAIDRESIDEQISGNPYKTIKAFKLLGIDMQSDPSFNQLKDLVGTIVDKRNKIIHYNDSASDISLGDLKNHVASFASYGKAIALHTGSMCPDGA